MYEVQMKVNRAWKWTTISLTYNTLSEVEGYLESCAYKQAYRVVKIDEPNNKVCVLRKFAGANQ